MSLLLATIESLYSPGGVELRAALPEMYLGLTLIAVLAVPLLGGTSRAAAGVTALLGLCIALCSSIHVARSPALFGDHFGNHMLIVDGVSSAWRILLILCAIGVILLWLRRQERWEASTEFLLLVVGATFGMSLLAQAGNILTLLIALELTSMPSYALAGFRKHDRGGAEAAIKYVLFGAAATAVMIFCATYLYGLFGTLDFAAMVDAFRAHGVGSPALLAIALIGLLIGLLFKLAAVPLHLWCPDTFQGASVEVATFLSIASKGAALLQLGRLIHWADLATIDGQFVSARNTISIVIAAVAIVSMTLGNFAALSQHNLKRLLAYSSIAQAGYMLVGLAALLNGTVGPRVMPAIVTYLAAYLLMNLGAFAVAAAVQRDNGQAEIIDLTGLGSAQPLLAGSLTLCLFSFVGLPPLAGFSVKLNLMLLMIGGGGAWWIAVAAIGINSALSLAYYARPIRAMYLDRGSGRIRLSLIARLLAASCAVLLIVCFFAFNALQWLTAGVAYGN